MLIFLKLYFVKVGAEGVCCHSEKAAFLKAGSEREREIWNDAVHTPLHVPSETTVRLYLGATQVFVYLPEEVICSISLNKGFQKSDLGV